MSNVTIPRIFKQEQNIKKPLITITGIIIAIVVVVYHVQKCHEKKKTWENVILTLIWGVVKGWITTFSFCREKQTTSFSLFVFAVKMSEYLIIP